MDYTDSGFKAGFAHGMHVCLTAMLFRPLRHEPWPAPPMPSLRDHLEAYGGTRMSPADFDRARRTGIGCSTNGNTRSTVTCWACAAHGMRCPACGLSRSRLSG